MNQKVRKFMSIFLIFAMIIGIFPANIKTVDAEAIKPTTENKITTFSYQGKDETKTVNLAGEMNGWDPESISLEKGENNLFSKELELEPGKYQYKFVIDGKWMEGDNLEYVVKGIKIQSDNDIKLGDEISLKTINVIEDGSENEVNATYRLKEDYTGVKLEGDKLSILDSSDVKDITVISNYDNKETEKTIHVLSQMFEYTINYKRNDGNQINWDMWVFGDGLDGRAIKFTEENDGYAKATFKLPKNNITVITRPGNWVSQEADRKISIADGEYSGEFWIIQNDETVYTSKPDENTPKPKQRQIQFTYLREDNNYEGWNLWLWSSGLSDGRQDFEGNVSVFPIAKTTTDVGFIVRKSIEGNDWAEKDPNKDIDRSISTDPNALELTTKVVFESGNDEFRTIPYLKGPEIKDGNITFFYRDIDLYEENKMDNIDNVKINIIKKNLEDGKKESLGSFAMKYSKDNERFEYTLEKTEDGFDYIYTFDVTKDNDTEKGLNDVSNTKDGISYVRLIDLDIDVKASLNRTEAKAGESVLVDIEINNPDNHEIKEVYLDLRNLNQGKSVVAKDLLKHNVALPLDLTPGEKGIDVVVVDNYEKEHKATVKLNTLASTDTKETIAWDEEIIYFMLTDRFFDGDKANNNPNNDESYDTNHLEAFHGGDFQGIIDKVDYLKELGVSTVWITPIVKNIETNQRESENDKQYGYHGYWAKDFTQIEPRLGDVEKLKELIDVLHENDIKLMVDVVLNHSGYGTNNDEIFEGMIRTNPGADDITSELAGLPDFITEDPEVSAKLVKWQSDWLKTLTTDKGNTVDYFRIDTVKHVEKDTWKEFKNSLVNIKPDFKIIGEYYGASAGNNGGYLGNGMMDSVLDFEFKSLAENFVKGNIQRVEDRLKERNESITDINGLGQFLSSHDEDGFLSTRVNGNKDLLKVAASLQMTAKGQPVIYYGEEIGMSGKNADFSVNRMSENRESFKWDQIEDNDILEHYRKIINIRRDNSEVFSRGDRESLHVNNNVSVFKRSHDGESLLVGLNISDQDQKVSFNLDKNLGNKLIDIYNDNKEYIAENGKVEITIPANSKGGTSVFKIEKDPSLETEDPDAQKVIFHFEDPQDGEWEMYVWPKGGNGERYPFTRKEGDTKIAEIVLDKDVEEIGFIVKGSNSADDWRKDVDKDRFVTITKNPQNVYLKSGVEDFTTDGIDKPMIDSFTIDDFRKANLVLSKEANISDIVEDYTLEIKGEDIKNKVESIESTTENKENSKSFAINFKEDLPIDENIDIKLILTSKDENDENVEYELTKTSRLYKIFETKKFEDRYSYDGELGAIYSSESTEFKVWAPTAKNIDLIIYDGRFEEGSDKNRELVNEEKYTSYQMTRNDKGVWSYKLDGDQLGKAYMFNVDVYDNKTLAIDPYAKSVTINGERGVVVDPKKTDSKTINKANSDNPIIYELHVRDLSIQENSGIENKGKFLGVVEEGTKTPSGQITGLDYIKSLGVTHVQFIPVYDYSKYSVDETRLDEPQFNWGYDPVNYNAIEGSYSTDPYDPFNRISEFQEMVDKLHDNNLGVIMDVVYNHVAGIDQHSFDKIVPGYYFRQDAKGNFLGGTGVGNETASERKMVRKFIVDSTKYLAETYNLDGFRFDLMGTHDYKTINEVREELDKINPNIFILGEGWNMDMGIPEDQRATQVNAVKISDRVAFFNDDLRDAVKGSVFGDTDPGFVNGALGKEEFLLQNIRGGEGLKTYKSANQIIQYVEAHDNLTLWDKLKFTNPDEDDETLLKRHKMSTTIVTLSQGTPFIHAGQEFARTKDGDHNSYKSSDEINRIDWDRAEEFSTHIDYFRELVKIRKAYNVFDLKEYSDINRVFNKLNAEDQLIAYELKDINASQNSSNEHLYISYNASNETKEINVDNGTYKVLVRDQKANVNGLETIEVTNGKVEVLPLSSLVLAKNESEEEPEEPKLHDTKGYITGTTNVRISPNGPVIGTLEREVIVEGEYEEGSDWVKFDYYGQEAYVYKPLLSDTIEVKGFSTGNSNIRKSPNGEVTAIAKREEIVEGVVSIDNPNWIKTDKGYIYRPLVVDTIKVRGLMSGTTNVRMTPNGTIIGTLGKAEYVEGTLNITNPNWVKTDKGYIYRPLLVDTLKIKGLMVDTTNVRMTPNGTLMGTLGKAEYVEGTLNIANPNWVRIRYQNRDVYIYRSLIVDSVSVSGIVTDTVNVRQTPNGKILGAYRKGVKLIGKVYDGNSNWIEIQYNGQRAYVYKEFVK
ncbi:type I pullulanase [Helcococcus sueciensis]|uniref:type I pullulanase n=1 Tax=Helcococcus sueciensis TaxID=241555 RepID=UPI0004243E2D|nr:type I pullulanase [Helcococcus sueciensis]